MLLKLAKNIFSSVTSTKPLPVLDAVDRHKSRVVNEHLLYKVPLIPVNCSFGIVSETPDKKISLRAMTQKERKAVDREVTIIFAIRRPGCGACREHGLQLTKIAQEEEVCLVGAIKQLDIHNKALLEFYEKYFKYPIYRDEKWLIYHALGGRKITFWKLLTSARKLGKRYKEKNIQNIPFGGDIWTEGGILIFDQKGDLRYTYYETYGEEMNMVEIRKGIQDARGPSIDH
jgi:hypothetical protein